MATKLRWDLAADPAEPDAIAVFTTGECKDTPVRYTPAPQPTDEPRSRAGRRAGRGVDPPGLG
ncbi:hypothetical protein GCM10010245_58060 [Streptomyces spectabilis]|nr:hypothetical protein GCM10010245_58060 [Streptomyces spectabilis]